MIKNERKITIVGAGLVGSFFAIQMAKRGFQVEIFEKRSDLRASNQEAGRSINLVVTSRGINALTSIDLWQEVKKITVPVTGRMMHSKAGDLTYQPYGKDSGDCNYSVSRSELNKLLLSTAESLGAKVKFQHTLEKCDFSHKILQFSCQAGVYSCEYDMIFGADGAGSVVRRELINGGYSKENVNWIGVDYKELFMPAGADGKYQLDKNALHIWPRGSHMLMALPNLDGSFTMTLYLPESEGISFQSLDSSERVMNYFTEYLSDSIPLMPNFQNEFSENPVGKLGTVRCNNWVYGDSAALIGDAAHGVVPFFGQGMNGGFEDCTVLSGLMNEHDNWKEVLERYYVIQKPNGDAIGDMAEENYHEMAHKVSDLKFLKRKEVEQILMSEFPGSYRSRYWLVVYSLIPYSVAKQIGKLNEEVLDELCAEGISANDLDLSKAEKLINEKILPLIKEFSVI